MSRNDDDIEELRAALATATLDRDVWRAQAEAAQRERDEARADATYHSERADAWQARARDLEAG